MRPDQWFNTNLLIIKNMTIKSEKERELFSQLRKLHDLYIIATEEQKGKILSVGETLFKKLEGLGYDKVWVETLLIGGKDFLDSLYGEGEGMTSEHDIELIFSN